MSSIVTQISKKLEKKVLATSELIENSLKAEKAPVIQSIASHLIKSGGKRIRPLLTLAVADIFHYKGEADIYLATAIMSILLPFYMMMLLMEAKNEEGRLLQTLFGIINQLFLWVIFFFPEPFS